MYQVMSGAGLPSASHSSMMSELTCANTLAGFLTKYGGTERGVRNGSVISTRTTAVSLLVTGFQHHVTAQGCLRTNKHQAGGRERQTGRQRGRDRRAERERQTGREGETNRWTEMKGDSESSDR